MSDMTLTRHDLDVSLTTQDASKLPEVTKNIETTTQLLPDGQPGCHICSCALNVDNRTRSITHIEPSTGARHVIYRCAACDFRIAVYASPRVDVASKRGGRASASISRGATDMRGKKRA